MEKNDPLKLDNQLCFPLYAASKELIRHYKPILDNYDLTYTQYITMLVLWENKTITIKELGKKLYLDSGTLTPLVKKLVTKGYVTKKRDDKDERNLIVSITKKGLELKDKIKDVPNKMSCCVNLNKEESIELYQLLQKMLKNWDDKYLSEVVLWKDRTIYLKLVQLP